jgi:hypothetical protein
MGIEDNLLPPALNDIHVDEGKAKKRDVWEARTRGVSHRDQSLP